MRKKTIDIKYPDAQGTTTIDDLDVGQMFILEDEKEVGVVAWFGENKYGVLIGSGSHVNRYTVVTSLPTGTTVTVVVG